LQELNQPSPLLIERIAMDLDSIRSEFSIVRKYVYLDHAAVGPLPNRVLEATKRGVEEKSEGDLHWNSWEENADATRKSIARLIKAGDDEVALMHSTSEGLAVVANGLSYEKGQNIVTSDMEFASNLFPWQALAKRYGLELRVVRNHDGKLGIEDFDDAVDSKTRLVAISYVQYSNGFRSNLAEISRIAHEKEAYVVTDAVQAVGQMPIDVTELGVDFLATSGYKWLLSPLSTGFLYVKRGLFDELWPTIVGYHADENPLKFSFREFQPSNSARRYEGGQLNFPGFAGIKEAINLLEGVGLESVWQRVSSLVDRLHYSLKQNNRVQVRSHLDAASRSGILNLGCEAPELIARRLLEKQIVVSVRDGGLRVSPHFYNTEDEVDRFLAELRAVW
jgi:cysteine desulfurase/selenocysteine lyase